MFPMQPTRCVCCHRCMVAGAQGRNHMQPQAPPSPVATRHNTSAATVWPMRSATGRGRACLRLRHVRPIALRASRSRMPHAAIATGSLGDFAQRRTPAFHHVARSLHLCIKRVVIAVVRRQRIAVRRFGQVHGVAISAGARAALSEAPCPPSCRCGRV